MSYGNTICIFSNYYGHGGIDKIGDDEAVRWYGDIDEGSITEKDWDEGFNTRFYPLPGWEGLSLAEAYKKFDGLENTDANQSFLRELAKIANREEGEQPILSTVLSDEATYLLGPVEMGATRYFRGTHGGGGNIQAAGRDEPQRLTRSIDITSVVDADGEFTDVIARERICLLHFAWNANDILIASRNGVEVIGDCADVLDDGHPSSSTEEILGALAEKSVNGELSPKVVDMILRHVPGDLWKRIVDRRQAPAPV